jgi:hypothetical protein
MARELVQQALSSPQVMMPFTMFLSISLTVSMPIRALRAFNDHKKAWDKPRPFFFII